MWGCDVGRNGERRRWALQASVADVAGVVVVEQVVSARSAARADGSAQGLQVVDDRGHGGLAHVRTVGVGAAGVSILIVPIVGAGLRIGIFDLLGRWSGDVAVAIAVPHGIGVAEHDVVGAGASHDRLVHVVAQGVVVGEKLHVGSVALLHVIETESVGTFACGHLGEGIGAWSAVAAGAVVHFDPGEEVA